MLINIISCKKFRIFFGFFYFLSPGNYYPSFFLPEKDRLKYAITESPIGETDCRANGHHVRYSFPNISYVYCRQENTWKSLIYRPLK